MYWVMTIKKSKTKMEPIRIYLTNLAKYNEGRLVGKWVDLPLDESDLEKAVKDVLGTDEESFVTDYEAPFRIEEYENPFELNKFAEQLEELEEYEQEKVYYLLDNIGHDREEALENHEDVIFYPEMTLEDVAYELIEDGVFGELTDTIKGYIDYQKLARDLSIDGYHETDKGVFWYQ